MEVLKTTSFACDGAIPGYRMNAPKGAKRLTVITNIRAEEFNLQDLQNVNLFVQNQVHFITIGQVPVKSNVSTAHNGWLPMVIEVDLKGAFATSENDVIQIDQSKSGVWIDDVYTQTLIVWEG